MDEKIRGALKLDMVVDITTTGRSSGEPRRIEIWSHYLDGQVIVTGSPGHRSWYANMVANPRITYHLKDEVKADLPATVQPITDDVERRAIFTRLKEVSRFRQGQPMTDPEEWVKGSRLVEVTFDG